VALPGNAELLRIGALRGEMDGEDLREELWHAILGHPRPDTGGLGSLLIEPRSDLKAMLEEIERRGAEVAGRIEAGVAPYLPAEVEPLEATVRLHLGGTWNGRTSSDIYVSLSFLHSFAPPWLDGLDSIIAHEVIHKAHQRLGPLPSDAQSVEGILAVALSQIHAEGVARHVEHRLLEGEHAPDGYAAFASGRYRGALAGFGAAFLRLEEIRESCMRRRDLEGCRDLVASGLVRGGATYAIGQGMSAAIESAMGRGTLGSTLASGPEEFFRLYLQARRMLTGYPAPGEGFEEDLRAAGRWLDRERSIWGLRAAARRAHDGGDFDRAAALLEDLMALAPRSAVDAYNLSCALARAGDEGEALEWLERAIDLGYRDGGFLASDPDLEGLRRRSAYRRLLDRLGAGPDPPNASRK
jgi:tetratricopeptide (TPR) repeat protein